MFWFREIKKYVDDWTQDVKGQYERELPILKKVSDLIKEITMIWEMDKEYRKYSQELNIIKFSYFDTKKFEILFEEFKNEIKEKNYNEKNLELVLRLAKKYNFPINSEVELNELKYNLSKYKKILELRESYKLSLLKENTSLIFKNCLLISAYQKKYSELYKTIGYYKDVELYLGFGGSNIISENKSAIDYIGELEKILERIEEEQVHIELAYQSKGR